MHGLSRVASSGGLLSSCDLWAPHCGGVSCPGARALGCSGFSDCVAWSQPLWCTGLVVLGRVQSSQTPRHAG